MKRPRKKGSAKIGEAVFLGRKNFYTFDVYPLTGDVPESAGVFIFSRRKIDKAGRASHAASCIGETMSIAAELKKHKRAKCVKLNSGNVVCFFNEESGRSRSAVLGDITAARNFSCIKNVFEPTMLRKPHVQPKLDKKTFPAIPAVSVDLPLKPKRRKRIAEPQTTEAVGKAKATVVFPAPDSNSKRAGAKPVAAKTRPSKAARAKAEKPKATTPAKRTTAKPRPRVQSGVDRNGGQHRLPKQKRPAAGRAKTRAAGRSGASKKAAAYCVDLPGAADDGCGLPLESRAVVGILDR